MPTPDRSDAFGWGTRDVAWEDPPTSAPPLPAIPGADRPSVVPDRFPRPTGAALFMAKSKEEQDAMLGPEVAQAVRDGDVKFEDLVRRNPMETEDDFITQASAQDLGLK